MAQSSIKFGVNLEVSLSVILLVALSADPWVVKVLQLRAPNQI